MGDCEACLEVIDKLEDPNGYSKWTSEVELIRQKIKLTGALIWVQIHEKNPKLLLVKHLGLREDWQIVASDERISIDEVISDVLRMIMLKNTNGCHGKN